MVVRRGTHRALRLATESTPSFELRYVRTGPPSARPIVVIPGGPGLGSLRPYHSLRRIAAQGGLDLIMVEHRGIGASRADTSGAPLPQSAMRISEVIDDLAAVLDRERVESAFIAGSSYGSYLASGFGVRYPERVAGMLLDSALQSTTDLHLERSLMRRLFWDEPEIRTRSTDESGGAGSTSDRFVIADVRRLFASGVDERELLNVLRSGYELGGYRLLRPLLRQRLAKGGGLVWQALKTYAARDETLRHIPGYFEFGIAGAIGFRELNYGAPPDGMPLDPALTYAPLAHRFPAFAGEPFDLVHEIPKFNWPMLLLAGSRDIRTPPAIARRTAEAARDAVLVEIENGHSALDTHPVAFLNALRRLRDGTHRRLPEAARRLETLPRRGAAARLPGWLMTVLSLEARLARSPA